MYWGIHVTALAMSGQLLGKQCARLNVTVKQTYQAPDLAPFPHCTE